MKRIIEVRDRLKFSKRDAEIFGWATIILAVIAVVAVVLTILCYTDVITDSAGMGIIMLGLPVAVFTFLGALALYLDAKIYLADLDKKGYIVPETKQDCDYRLSELLRDEQEPPMGKIYKRHLVLAIVMGGITLFTAIYMFTFAKRPYPFILLIMIIMVGATLLQAFNRLFKNDIDINVLDSRWVRQRIIVAIMTVLITYIALFYIGAMSSILPTGNRHYYAQIVHYLKRENPEDYRFYMDRLPSYAEDVDFISWGKACGVSFFVPQENIKDIQAYYEGMGEPYIIHTIEEGEEEFISLCRDIKESTRYFKSEDYANCMVYEFTEWDEDQWGHKFSWYAIMDTNSGEVGYGYCPTDW